MSERDELRELCCLFLKQHGADNRKEYLFPYDKGKLILDDNKCVLIIEDNNKNRYFELKYCLCKGNGNVTRIIGSKNIVGNINTKCYCSEEKAKEICDIMSNMNWIKW